MSVSTDEKLCVSSSLNGKIIVNDCQTGNILSTLYQKHGNISVQWNSKHAMFANVNHKGSINLWKCNF